MKRCLQANRGLRYFRFAASLFYPIDMNSTYATNPDEYWRKFDVMISDAEALNVSLIACSTISSFSNPVDDAFRFLGSA